MKKKINNFSAEYLRSIVRYDPATGLFWWRERPSLCVQWNGRWANKQAGTLSKATKAVSVTIDFIHYEAHILAWVYMTGEWPIKEIDHKNKIRSDNRWDNLRLATRSQQEANKTVLSNNKTGLRGVTKDNRNKYRKYRATISVNGKQIHLGVFLTPEEAHEAYKKAAEKYSGEFAGHLT